MTRESSEPRRWTVYEHQQFAGPAKSLEIYDGSPQSGDDEAIEVMPVSEHERQIAKRSRIDHAESERLHAQLADLREAAQTVLDTLDRSSSFSVKQVDALRAALGQEEGCDE